MFNLITIVLFAILSLNLYSDEIKCEAFKSERECSKKGSEQCKWVDDMKSCQSKKSLNEKTDPKGLGGDRTGGKMIAPPKDK
jgi:hypothetical protein